MSRREVEEYVWKSLSARRWAVGRAAVDRITRRTIRRWDREPRLDAIGQAVTDDTRREVGLGIIASWLLAALVSEIVRAVWAWWSASHANHCLLFGYQREMPDDD